jgi:hypothetical protein
VGFRGDVDEAETSQKIVYSKHETANKKNIPKIILGEKFRDRLGRDIV